jgi:S-adenosylmethionine:tRNA ribosyltransferase-isomerase
MHLSDFEYELPEELIAQHPLERRDAARMLVLNREQQTWKDSQFELLPEYVMENDVIVVNNTRVFPARLVGKRDPSGGRVEVLLVRELKSSVDTARSGEWAKGAVWEALVRPAHRLKPGAHLRFGDGQLRAEVLGSSETGLRQLKFEGDKPLETLINELGQTPLPPYIKRPSEFVIDDRERYQTVFAR